MDTPAPEEDDEYDEKFVIFDEEGVAICDKNDHQVPKEYYKMHIEYTPNSIERIYYHGISGHVSTFKYW